MGKEGFGFGVWKVGRKVKESWSLVDFESWSLVASAEVCLHLTENRQDIAGDSREKIPDLLPIAAHSAGPIPSASVSIYSLSLSHSSLLSFFPSLFPLFPLLSLPPLPLYISCFIGPLDPSVFL